MHNEKYDANDREDEVYGDGPGTVVMQEAPIVRKILKLRTNTFYTRCTMKGKIYGLIIDEGSCENNIPKEGIKKLQLKTKMHPTP